MSRAAVKAKKAARDRARRLAVEQAAAEAVRPVLLVVCDGCRFEVVNRTQDGSPFEFVFPCWCGSETAVYAVKP